MIDLGENQDPRPQTLDHARGRLARAAVLTYVGAAAVALSVLVFALVTDRAHDVAAAREQLLLGTVLRGEALGRNLAVLGRELERLGASAEIDPDDGTVAPERELLRLTHRDSTFFNVGVAILDGDGAVVWAEPERFLAGSGVEVASSTWFRQVLAEGRVRIVPVEPDREDALVYVVAPISRGGAVRGALVGAIDLAKGSPFALPTGDHLTLLASRDGLVVVPAIPPDFSTARAFVELVADSPTTSSLQTSSLEGVPREIAISPVAETDWVLMTVAEAERLYAPASRRFATRLAIGGALLLAPIVLLAIAFRRTVRGFRQSEDELIRAERMRLLGEASSAIAHEVRNSLNGIRVGLDLVIRGSPARPRIVDTLRGEVQRLSDFSSSLLSFSKREVARLRPVDLTALARSAVGIQGEVAVEQGVSLDLEVPDEVVEVLADPSLVQVILTNLVRNALDAVSIGSPAQPRVVVRLDRDPGQVRLSVVDNGPGVEAGMSSRLFEPFVTGKPSGVGIGLALARNLAVAQGGELSLEPTEGGARFTFSLPVEDPEPVKREPVKGERETAAKHLGAERRSN